MKLTSNMVARTTINELAYNAGLGIHDNALVTVARVLEANKVEGSAMMTVTHPSKWSTEAERISLARNMALGARNVILLNL